jgi:hypothetical protein
MELYKVPEILIIQLKRFKELHNNSEKSMMKINFPIEGLNMTNYVLNKDATKT